MTSSERRREAALAKIRREEVERQVEAKLRLKKQEIQIQSMKGQLDLHVVVEVSRQKLAEATIEEAEYRKKRLKFVNFVVADRNWQWPFRRTKRRKTGQEVG